MALGSWYKIRNRSSSLPHEAGSLPIQILVNNNKSSAVVTTSQSWVNVVRPCLGFTSSSTGGVVVLRRRRRRRRRLRLRLMMEAPHHDTVDGSSSYSNSNSNSNTAASPLKKTRRIADQQLRHMDSIASMPSGAGKIPRLNAVILGEALASEDDDLVFPSDHFSTQALIPSPQKYLEMYTRSIEDPAGFWSDIASEFYWKQQWGQEIYSENLDIRKGNIKIEWFKGGITNICYNCLDRNVESGMGDKIAFYWEGNETDLDDSLTYRQLLERVCQDVVPKYPTTCAVEWVDAEDSLFLLYTSGSTGKPKGVLHTTGGYMIYTATTFKYAFDYKPSDIYWCTADCGWITGHSYVTYGPLLNGATVVVFEGAPNYPDSGRCWDIVDKYKVTIFYTAPTLVRSLMRDGDEYVTRYSRKSLRVLGSVGEPINPSAWRLQALLLDKDGYHWLTGRVDDVINVSGHRIGTAEVESALVSHPHCAEAAVVGVEHEVKGQGIYAFVTLIEGVDYSEELRKSLKLTVRNQIGAFAAPDRIHWAPGLPKTRSGKIMRRILRKIAARQLDELGDTSTLADPNVVEKLIELADH
ncbi:hypothetical protein TEA_004572 [Camellia sinensis var. sinensis]|uniref:acetate--CoA ligase n=1 Tax=Camellia sinensis var. sinensis TaxID=542762 RepID=A0A4V3WKU9_CAMSN|nr:hypothetical protein TEA_004572 [Camellia sinensis var. sinensis]